MAAGSRPAMVARSAGAAHVKTVLQQGARRQVDIWRPPLQHAPAQCPAKRGGGDWQRMARVLKAMLESLVAIV